jgi:hypothetical protein
LHVPLHRLALLLVLLLCASIACAQEQSGAGKQGLQFTYMAQTVVGGNFSSLNVAGPTQLAGPTTVNGAITITGQTGSQMTGVMIVISPLVVSTLPTGALLGQIQIVSDWNGTVGACVGGGSVWGEAIWSGTAWQCH